MSDSKKASTEPKSISFSDLNLPAPLLKVLDEVGYESPSPIQAQAIPHLLEGLDLLGRAPTGTGKTAAFALPLLARLDMSAKHVQILTLTPTRELAMQVAEAFKRYASHMPGFQVLPIYGGQEYSGQLKMLKRGVQVVVGTPGRVVDHMRRKTLRLDKLQALVLDEADEMLRMGFIDEVEWILEQTPKQRQMALFSATMPSAVERIARRYLDSPREVSIESRTATAETIRQRYWLVSGLHKLDALTRILEVEPYDAILMFVRTKIATTELAEKLEARGYAAAALNGDMPQKQREQMISRLKRGSLDILVATDVAARGLDVERISHVVNYDIPYDTEAYIHRIGRTGRAGRRGDAILFVAPRERRMLKAIERATRQPIEALELPSSQVVTNKRVGDFKQTISDTLAAGDLNFMQGIIEQYQAEHNVPAIEIAAALAKILSADKPLVAKPDKHRKTNTMEDFTQQTGGIKSTRDKSKKGKPGRDKAGNPLAKSDADKERYRISVGYRHGVKPGNIVGAIANEADLNFDQIGHIEIETNYSLIDLPKNLPRDTLETLKQVKVCGKRLELVLFDSAAFKGKKDGDSKPGKKRFGKPGKKPESKFGKKPASKFAKKPGKSSANESEKKSASKFAKKSETKSETKSESKFGQKPKPGKKSESKFGQKPGKKPGKKSASKFAKKPGKSSAKKPASTKGKKTGGKLFVAPSSKNTKNKKTKLTVKKGKVDKPG